jgi:deoxycytidylate deaminase
MKKRFFNLARRASLKSDHPLHRLGAVIVRGNRIVSIGYNKYKTNPHSPHPYKHVHAEVMAILRSNGECVGGDLYIYREGRDGLPRISRPCKSCILAIKKAGIKNIYYTDMGFIHEAVSEIF